MSESVKQTVSNSQPKQTHIVHVFSTTAGNKLFYLFGYLYESNRNTHFKVVICVCKRQCNVAKCQIKMNTVC